MSDRDRRMQRLGILTANEIDTLRRGGFRVVQHPETRHARVYAGTKEVSADRAIELCEKDRRRAS